MMFVNKIDDFLRPASVSAGLAFEGRDGPHVTLEFVAQLIPLICGAAVFVTPVFVNLANRALGMAQVHPMSETFGIASVAAVIGYGLFRQAKGVQSTGGPSSRPPPSSLWPSLRCSYLLGGEKYSPHFLALWLSTSCMMKYGRANRRIRETHKEDAQGLSRASPGLRRLAGFEVRHAIPK